MAVSVCTRSGRQMLTASMSGRASSVARIVKGDGAGGGGNCVGAAPVAVADANELRVRQCAIDARVALAEEAETDHADPQSVPGIMRSPPGSASPQNPR